MNKLALMIAGFLFVSVGLLTGVYVLVNGNDKKSYSIQEKINMGEELLKQSNRKSTEKALSIFSELSSKNIDSEYKFRVKFGLAHALEKNKDRLLALEIYKELNQYEGLSKEQREKLGYALGNLLLNLNQEEEGKIHLDFVLKTSEDRKIRSKALSAIADYYMRKKEFEKARKNYILAVQEYPSNVHARIGWGKALRELGKDFASYDIFDDYLEDTAYIDKDEPKVATEYKASVFEKAKTYYNKRKFEKALQHFKKALAVSESAIQTERSLYYIAECYYSLGKFKESLNYIEQVLTNENTSLDQAALYRRGIIAFRSGKYDKAAAVFQDVVEKYPSSSFTTKANSWRKESLELMNEESLYTDGEKKQDNSADTKKKPVQEELDSEDEPLP